MQLLHNNNNRRQPICMFSAHIQCLGCQPGCTPSPRTGEVFSESWPRQGSTSPVAAAPPYTSSPRPSTTTRQQGSKNQTSGLLSWASYNWPKVTLCIYAQLKNLHTFKLLSTRYVVTQNIHWPLAECILIEVIIHSAPAARTPTWYVWK